MRGPSLRLVCVNDVYLLDHLPRLKSLIAAALAKDPADAAKVTLAGDFLAPSLLSSIDHGRGMLDSLNALPVDLVCFGNHEQDIPFQELVERTLAFEGVWLNTNIPSFPAPLPRHFILEVKGARTVRVGFVGVVTEDKTLYRPDAFGGHPMLPANASVVEEGRRLMQAHGCQTVIAMTHQSLDRDRSLAVAHGDLALPLILGGHEHEPHVEEHGPTWIMKAGTDAIYGAVVDLVWPLETPKDGELDMPKVSVRLERVDAYPDDVAMRKRVERHLRVVKALHATPLARIPDGETLSSVGTRMQQTSVGTMIATKVREATHADLCLINGGGIRGSKQYQGVFTCGDLETELPFANEVVVTSMPGRVVRDCVKGSRAKAPQPAPGFLQVDDGVEVDASERVVRVGGVALGEDRDYRVATVRVLFDGMDGIAPLVAFAQAHPDRIPPRDSGRELKVLVVDAVARELWKRLGTFESIDTDHDGRLSTEEIRAAIGRAGEDPNNAVLVNGIVNLLDANLDGVISRPESEKDAK